MSSLWIKIIGCPLTLMIAAWILPNVQYGAYYQPIVVGLILAVAGVLMEYMLLREDTLWTSTLLDFAVSVLIVYFVSNLFPGAYVTWVGAFITGVLLAVVEYITHSWLIRSGRTRKSPA